MSKAQTQELLNALKEARSMLASVGTDDLDRPYMKAWKRGIKTIDTALKNAGAPYRP